MQTLETFVPSLIFGVVAIGVLAIKAYANSISSETLYDYRDSSNEERSEPLTTETSMTETERAQIEQIERSDMKELLEKMPYGGWIKKRMSREGWQWKMYFECTHINGRFFASAIGQSPRAAFAMTKHLLLTQVHDWHKSRFNLVEVKPQALPKVLIVDDDVDAALALQATFNNMGYRTEVVTRHSDLHRKIAIGDADYIFLDWKLNSDVTADTVLEKTIRLIETFSDLRGKFSLHPSQIVTFSALPREKIEMPSGVPYFTHLDHWQKPMPFHEVVERASKLMMAS